jgi:phage major head subunit gpT-like protein
MSIEKKRDAMIGSLLHRAQPTHFKRQNTEYDSMTLLEIGKSLLREGGVNLSGKTKAETVDILMRGTRDMSVSDFPLLLENAANKMLREGYGLGPESWARIAKEVSVTNFKEQSLYQLGSSNNMKEIPEGEEIEYGKLLEAKQSIKVKSYGEGLIFTRQMLINDDLGALESIPQKFVRDWDLKRGDLVWSLINNNVVMHDGFEFFSPEHNNLSANPAPLNDDSLTEALLAFRRQKDIDGETNIRANPQFIIVGSEQEIPARKLLTSIVATKTGEVNVFSSMGLELIVEPRIPGMAWYLSASPMAIDGLCYAYLGGADKLRSNIENIFATDSINYAVRGEFGVAAIDYRGWYKNAGT